MSLLATNCSPIGWSPQTRPAIAAGKPLRSNTPAMILVVAIADKGVVGDGFHSVALPAANESDRFLWEHRIEWIVLRKAVCGHHP